METEREAEGERAAAESSPLMGVDGSLDAVAGTFFRLGVDLLMVSCADGLSVHVPLVAVVEVCLADGP